MKVVMDNDFIGDDVEMETNIFGVWHGDVEVDIGEVDAQKRCPWGTDGGIDEEFGRGEISRWLLDIYYTTVWYNLCTYSKSHDESL
jgi:hypothetical protein